MSEQVLLCDFSLAPVIGLALCSPGRRPDHIEHVSCHTREDFEGHVARVLGGIPDIRLLGVAISARGWEQHGELHLKGVEFPVDRDYIRSLLDVQRVNFVNNFVARALAIPGLKRNERLQISGGEVNDEQAIAVLGPHFGLGLASLVSDGVGGWTALHGEGGHSDLPARDEREWRIIEAIRTSTGYVSRESGISVGGLTDIHCALQTLSGHSPVRHTPAEIISAAQGGDVSAVDTINTMTGWLGAMAADIALIMGASGGIYLTGALLDMLGGLFNTDVFVARYLDKGPMSGYVSRIPVFRTQREDLELIGLATLYD